VTPRFAPAQSRTSPTSKPKPWSPKACNPCLVRRAAPQPQLNRHHPMLRWILTFLVIAIIAALLGFTGVAGVATDIARILFFIFIVLFVAALLIGAFRGKPPG
jgi:uncharacterized membrane protein YtjA (UPF0391 family)